MHSKASLALGLGIMGISAWAVISAIDWPWKAALFPLAIGVPVFCLAVAEVLWVLFGPRPVPSTQAMDFQPSEELPPNIMLRRTLIGIAWILGFFGVIVLLGFPIAVPAFVFLYVKIQGKEGWGLSLIFALIVWAIFYGLFDRLLHLPFPAGWILPWVGIA